MPRMIDLIRASALPSHRMHSAARGALTVPPAEMIEILVHLANHNKIFGQQARMTLAGYDEASSIAVAKDPNAPKEVLQYMISAQNLRPALLSSLLENPSVSMDTIIELAGAARSQIAEVISKSARCSASTAVQRALASNPNFKNAVAVKPPPGQDEESAGVSAASTEPLEELMSADLHDEAAALAPSDFANLQIGFSEDPLQALQGDVDLDDTVMAYLTENAAEIAAEENKPFQAIGGIFDREEFGLDSLQERPNDSEAAAPLSEPEAVHSSTAVSDAAASPSAAVAAPALPTSHPQKRHAQDDGKRDNTLQKINKLDVKGRIQLAMKGNKEERSILIRDGTKLVAVAVLESGKITDSEVEHFASQKNVLEAVLRAIPMKRRFAKNYAVLRNLVFNPRTPLDVGLGLMKHLLVQDLRHLSGNKEVSETVRKLAIKMFKQKTDANKKKE